MRDESLVYTRADEKCTLRRKSTSDASMCVEASVEDAPADEAEEGREEGGKVDAARIAS